MAVVLVAGLALFGMAFSIRAQALRGDDFALVQAFTGQPFQRSLRRAFASWDDVLGASPWAAGAEPYQLIRPTTGLSFFVNAEVCGAGPACLAAGNVVLLLLAGAALCAAGRMIQLPQTAALAAPVLFWVNPGAISSQLAIADRTEAIAGLALLAALLAYHKCRRAVSTGYWAVWFAAAVAASAAAMGAKETAVLTPGILVGQALILGDWRQRRRFFPGEVVVLLCLLLGYLAARAAVLGTVGGQYGSVTPGIADIPVNLVRAAGALLFFNRQHLPANPFVTTAVAGAIVSLVLIAAAEARTSSLRRFAWIAFVAAAASAPALATQVFARLLFIPAAMLTLTIALAAAAPQARLRQIAAFGAASLVLLNFLHIYATELRSMQVASRRTTVELAALTRLVEQSPRPSVVIGFPAGAGGMAVFHRSFDVAIRATATRAQQPIVGLIGSQTPQPRCDVRIEFASSTVAASTTPPCELVLPNYPGRPLADAAVATRFTGLGPVTVESPTRVVVDVDRSQWDVIVPKAPGQWVRLE